MKMSNRNGVLLIIGIVLLFYGLKSANMLTIINVPNYTKYDFQGADGRSVILEGQTSQALSIAGNTYTVQVRTVPDFAGYAAVAFYKNGVQLDGTIQSVAPDCPSCTDYYPSVYDLVTGVKGSILCYTDRQTNLGQTFCYASIYFSTTTVPQPCIVNGVSYLDGAQIKLINACYSTFAGKVCPDNYQFTTCSNGVTYGMSTCYSGTSCASPSPDPTPTPTCTSGQTVNCTTSDSCSGVQTCSNNAWGACLKSDSSCGQTWMIPQWMYFVLIAAGIAIIGYTVMKK